MCQGGCSSGCNCTAVVVDSVQGPAGLTAYGQWLAAGNSGTEQDFLDSLIGAQGPTGATSADGAAGLAGANGADGADGLNAFALLNSSFNQPAVGANVFIQTGTVGGFSWMGVGQIIQIETGGFYRVVSTFNGGGGVDTNANVTNLGYPSDAFGFPGNAAPGEAVAINSKVSPGGVRGPAGATGATGPVGPDGATGPAGADGTDGTQISSGPELPNTLAPNVGATGDYRIRVSAGSPGVALDIWVKINNTPTWSLVAVFPNAAGGG